MNKTHQELCDEVLQLRDELARMEAEEGQEIVALRKELESSRSMFGNACGHLAAVAAIVADDPKDPAENWALVGQRLLDKVKQVRAERDLLAAHVERLHTTIDACYGDPECMHLEAGNVRDQGPVISLARMKAQWQAVAIEGLVPRVADEIGRALDLSEDGIIEVEGWLEGHSELCRQVEGGEA